MPACRREHDIVLCGVGDIDSSILLSCRWSPAYWTNLSSSVRQTDTFALGLLHCLKVIQFACLDGLLHASAELWRGEAWRLVKVRVLMDQREGKSREAGLLSPPRTISLGVHYLSTVMKTMNKI